MLKFSHGAFVTKRLLRAPLILAWGAHRALEFAVVALKHAVQTAAAAGKYLAVKRLAHTILARSAVGVHVRARRLSYK
jgi:hypothetical protein